MNGLKTTKKNNRIREHIENEVIHDRCVCWLKAPVF